MSVWVCGCVGVWVRSSADMTLVSLASPELGNCVRYGGLV